MDRVTFLDRVAEDGFLEWATILGEYYGTPMPETEPGRDIVLEIDVQGARQVLERCPGAHCVLVRAPSPEVQEERLRSRGDPEEHIRRRIALGKLEDAEGLALCSRVIVNDDLDKAVRELAEHRQRAARGDPVASCRERRRGHGVSFGLVLLPLRDAHKQGKLYLGRPATSGSPWCLEPAD